ncbi:hypothetical protein SAMN05421688_2475 [Poseidonocella pacifica]|uniref:Uncharacterized protein n=1 Tax=Poseidonocella pacifica TaxID=871651 RepID=A0A1I0XTS9_9RHOB|nr:hypothetical protein [Poseidonocella pacifica]SFB04314.1 hypothetical protein SAMN05421688_2475 [Poseidonocella pacifica]
MSTRTPIALATVVLLFVLIGWDLAAKGMPNAYQAPPLLALGSGQAAGGAHCAALPAQ